MLPVSWHQSSTLAGKPLKTPTSASNTCSPRLRSARFQLSRCLASPVVATLAAFSDHQLWCQINELFDCQEWQRVRCSAKTSATQREQMWTSGEAFCQSAPDNTDDTFHAFHVKNEKEEACETLMTLRGMPCSENLMWKWCRRQICRQQRSLKIKHKSRQHVCFNFSCLFLYFPQLSVDKLRHKDRSVKSSNQTACCSLVRTPHLPLQNK